jgi:hypothetical protein
MSYHYFKIDDLTFNGLELYFGTPLTTAFSRATTFSQKYLYYQLRHHKTDIAYVGLGSFIKIHKQNSGPIYQDQDQYYNVYEFTLENIKCKQNGQPDNIYFIGIPDSNENMYQVDSMFYKGLPVFSFKK